VWRVCGACLAFFLTLSGCKKGPNTGQTPSAEVFTFTKTMSYSVDGPGQAFCLHSLSLPFSNADSAVICTNSGIFVAANKIEDNSSGFNAMELAIASSAGARFTDLITRRPESSSRELIAYRSTNNNLELYRTERSSSAQTATFNRETLIASQANNVVSIAMTDDGEYFLLGSSSGNHKVLRRVFSSDSPDDQFVVTNSIVGTTVSVAVKALAANLNNSTGDTSAPRNEHEFLLVGNETIRILTPSNSQLYNDDRELTRSSTTEIRDAVLVNWDGDAYPDLLLLTESGLELFKNTSDEASNGSVQFESVIAFDAGLSGGLTNGTRLEMGDLNADGFEDLIILRSADDPLYLQYASANRLIDRSSSAFGSALSGDYRFAQIADVNNDARADVIFSDQDGKLDVFVASP
jgi:hypothetical protein